MIRRVRLNLADCYERQGKTATAWVEFLEARSRAEKLSDARATYARERAEGLAPRLVKMRIVLFSGAQPRGLAVWRDSNELPTEAFGIPAAGESR